MKNRIEQLKKEKNAVILAHYYAPAEAQKVADFVGDSFYLAKAAKETSADIIVFCGVKFMGESAKILNPDKKVLMPDMSSDCPMAHMATAENILKMREEYDDLAVVCYINSTAELKCLSDVCVTSSNAVKIVKDLENKNIYFIPDRNLGRFVSEQVPEKNIILNDGCCPIHTAITKKAVEFEKKVHPESLILVHPECEKEILALADYVGSTADMIKFAKDAKNSEFIVCTENGVSYRLINDNPSKKFYFPNPIPSCLDMKFNTLENILSVLEKEDNEVEMQDCVIEKALSVLERMLEMADRK